jgi:hypothetical protein
MASAVQRRFDGKSAALEDVGVDHGGFDVFVSEEFLNRSDVVTVLKEMSGETVAKGVRGNPFLNSGESGGFFDGFLKGGFVDVVTLGDAGARILGKVRGGKYILPKPFAVSVWIFFLDGVGKVYRAKAVGEVLTMNALYITEVPMQGAGQAVGEHGDAVVTAFTIADNELVVFKIHIFDAQAKTFHQTESAAV